MSDLEDERDLDLEEDDDAQDGDRDDEASQPPPEEDADEAPQRRGRKGQGRGRGKRLNLVNDFGKSRGFAKDGKKYCAPCGKWLPLSSFPAGSAQCGEDRKAIQNLASLSKKQGQEDWWQETVADVKKLKAVVKAYKALKPPPGKKLKEFVILQYIEERRRESAVLYDGVLEMMTLRGYMAWMAKPKNGGLDAETATTQWREKFNAPGAITDKKGDHPRFRDRVAISTKDLVVFRDADIKAQSYLLKDKESKNVDQAEIDKAELRLNRERQLKVSSDRSRTDQAGTMITAAEAAGTEGAFSADGKIAVQVGDVRNLIEDDADNDQMEDEGHDGDSNSTPSKTRKRDEESNPASGSKPGKKPKREAWFDRDGAVTSALRSHSQWLSTTKATISSTIKDLTGTLSNVTLDVKEEVRNETRLAKSRLSALKLVISEKASGESGAPDAPATPDVADASTKTASDQPAAAKPDPAGPDQGKPTEAEAGVAKAAEAAQQAQAAEAGQQAQKGAEDSASTVQKFAVDNDAKKALRKYIAQFSDPNSQKVLGSAPPCRSYQSLILFSEFEAYLGKFEQIEKKDDIVQLQQEMKAFKTAYSDLISMAKAANKRLEAAIDGVGKRKAAAATEASTSGKGKGKRARAAKKAEQPAAATAFVDQPNGVAADIASVVVKEDGSLASGLDVSVPAILRLEAAHFKREDIASIKASTLPHLEAKFKNDPARLASGRSQRSLPQEQEKSISDLIFKCFPEGHILAREKLTDKINKEVLVPAAFVVAKDQVTASAEAGHLPTCRVGMSGTRSVVAVRSLALLDYLTKSGTGGNKATLSAAYQWLKSTSVQAAKSFIESTEEKVGAQDVLYLPEGWMFYEKIMGKSNFLGVRLQFLSLKSLQHLEKINSYLLALGKPNAALQSAVDCLSLAE
ncbi:unnamed protein product [Symbiodinium sp. CCMP2456]|nr:unnamed protein product [Symbiodinium sp. CCMP2456]